MPAITRRTFLQVSSGALGVCAVGLPAGGRAAELAAPRTQPARVFMVLFGTAPSTDDTDLEPESHAEIVRRLREACPGVDIVVRDLTKDARLDLVLAEAKDLQGQGYDGVIVYGCPRDYGLIRTGLPTINVAVLNDFMNIPFPLYRNNRVISAMLDPWRFTADAAVRERMFRDLVEKLKLIAMLKRMRKEHILSVTDSPYVNVTYGDLRQNMPANYNETILGAIDATFGTRVTKIGTKEVVEDPYIRELWKSESREANEIAGRWIHGATKMVNTLESEVVRSAKVYLAMKHLMQRYEATAMAYHIRTLVPDPRREDYITPCAGTSEFQLHNVVAKCQSHLNVILSEMLLLYAYGRPSMFGDFSVDTYNNTSIVQHCEGPWNAWGDERRVPYICTDHRERPVRSRAECGVSVGWCNIYPPNEPVTMWQIDVVTKEIMMHTGTTVPMFKGPVIYRDHFYEMM